MRVKFLSILVAFALISCKGDDNGNLDDNPFLTDPLLNLNLNLNLPEFNDLKFPGNSVILNSQGIGGIVIYNVNNDLYTAFDLSDPNHVPNSCSRMTVQGIVATCSCEDYSYDIVTGQHQTDETKYPMQFYNVQRSGDNVFVSN